MAVLWSLAFFSPPIIALALWLVPVFRPSLVAAGGQGARWGVGFAAVVFVPGFFGPMIFMPDSNLGPILGIFAAPPAFSIGAIVGFAVACVRGAKRSKETRADEDRSEEPRSEEARSEEASTTRSGRDDAR